MRENDKREIRIGSKSKGSYINAVFYSFDHDDVDEVILTSLGSKNAVAYDILDRIEDIRDDVEDITVNTFEVNDVGGIEIHIKR